MDKIKIAEQQAINELQDANKNYGKDGEILHVLADRIILSFLENIGCDKIVALYKELSENFYYS